LIYGKEFKDYELEKISRHKFNEKHIRKIIEELKKDARFL